MEENSSKKYALLKWKLRGIKIWTIIGACILIVGILFVCGLIGNAVFAAICAGLIVFLLHGIVDRLERVGIKRIWGTLIAMLGAIIFVVGGIALITPSIAAQAAAFVEQLPTYAYNIEQFAREYVYSPDSPLSADQISGLINNMVDWFTSQLGTIVSTFATGLVSGVSSVGSGFIAFSIALLAAFWILIDLPKISKELRSLFNEKHQEDIDIITGSFGTAIYGWFIATIVCAVIAGVSAGIYLWLCGVPYFTVLAVIVGIAYIIPYIGSIIAGAIIAIVALTVSPFTCILAVGIYLVAINIIGNVISPILMKQSVNVHPAIILICLLIGSGLGGAIGMLAAVPIAAAAQSIFVSYYEARTGKKLYSQDGALFHDVKKGVAKDTHKFIKKFKRNKDSGANSVDNGSEDIANHSETSKTKDKNSKE